MSERGIEQPSSFGNAGGCFVKGLSFVGAAVVIGLLMYKLPSEEKVRAQDAPQPKVESVQQNTNTVPRDTVFINAFSNVR